MALQRPISRPAAWKKGQSGNPKGKKPGTKNRLRPAQAAAIAASGLTPLEFMLEVLRNPQNYSTHQRMWAANSAAPYVHRKMPIAVEGGDRPITVIDAARLGALSNSELKSILATLEKLGVTDMLAAVAIAHDADS